MLPYIHTVLREMVSAHTRTMCNTYAHSNDLFFVTLVVLLYKTIIVNADFIR